MKKLAAALFTLLLFAQALVLPLLPAKAIFADIPLLEILPVEPQTPKPAPPFSIPDLELDLEVLDELVPVLPSLPPATEKPAPPLSTLIPIPTATPKLGLPTLNIPKATPKPIPSRRPTLKPDLPPATPAATPAGKPAGDPASLGGQAMTSEGPLFLSFRKELTDERWMFTPMDLSIDGEFRIPLIGNASQVVGEAKAVVRSGMVIVTTLVASGVEVDRKNEFFTFFPDIRGVPSLKPFQLQHVKLEFGLPYSVASWLNSDPHVLLYINTPVSYPTDLAGLTPFSFQDPGYLERMMGLLPLMD